MKMTILENTLAELAVTSGTFSNLEDLLERLPTLPTYARTKLWSKIPSCLIGSFIPYIPYTGAITLQKKSGIKAINKLRAHNIKATNWYDCDHYRNTLLYPAGVYNIEHILNISAAVQKEDYLVTRPQLKAWSTVRRGKDLFIPGLNSFDITKAKNQLTKRAEDYGRSTISVNSLRSVGYFGSTDHVNLLESKVMMAHIKLHWASWKVQGLLHIDEIIQALTNSLIQEVLSGIYLSWSPERLSYKALEANNKEAALRLSTSNITLLTPFKKIIKPLSTLDYDIIENFAELEQIGNRLNNCIGSSYYARQGIIGRLCFLEIHYEGSDYVCTMNLLSGKVDQVKGKDNSKAPNFIKKELIELGTNLIKLNKK